MLRRIPDIIGSDLLKALADTGHGDLTVIADHFYPHVTKCPNGAPGAELREGHGQSLMRRRELRAG